MQRRTTFLVVLAVSVVLALLWQTGPRATAADHRDGPRITDLNNSPAIDLDDVYIFLDPNNNSRVIMAFDLGGPIIPPENANAGVFDSSANFRLQIENTGDAEGDQFFDIRFTRPTGSGQPQTAVVSLSGNGPPRTFTAATTPPSSTADVAPAPVVTVDEATGIMFSAGIHDDPFFFDLPAETRYRASLLAGQPNFTLLDRARDSFAGYNVLMVVLSVPAAQLRGPAGNVIGLSAYTQQRKRTTISDDGDPVFQGPFVTIDRMGVPAINSMLVPYARKDEYNRAPTTDDARGRFALDIRASLQALGTDVTGTLELGRLAVLRGDMLRLNLSVANTGPQGGDNPAAAFPNGRRPGDDVMDSLLTLINNRVALGDNVDQNDVGFRNVFPFFAPPHQPLPRGSVDPTQN